MASFSEAESVRASHFILPDCKATRMEDRDISRSASGSGARMSLSSRWQPEHLFLNSPAASTFWFCAGFLEQPGNEHTRTAKNRTLTCQRAMHTKQADLRSG